MGSNQKCSIDEMDDVIMKDLKEYADLAADDMKTAVKSAAKTVQSEIKEKAPVRTGAYKKSWTTKKVKEDTTALDMVVHSSNRYQIAHLLEYGHVKRGGGRVPGVSHIKPAEEDGKKQLVDDIKEALSHGS